jgi:mannose-1-phosphate guanylyltransferase/mannose-1-phosphate guanylyltransferase/mannose-6-phosphate isomerase
LKPVTTQHPEAVLAAGPGSKQAPIYPVLLSGGSGTRLWPLSRQSHPKQLLALTGPLTMLQETALRVDEESFQRMVVVGSSDHRFAIAEQLHAIGLTAPRIILEPVGRNTAPAAAVAALAAAEDDPDALVLLMPADHLIVDGQAFRRAVADGALAAAEGHVVLFGIAPKSPATGYGYIEAGEPLAGHAGIDTVVRFHEKPDGATAKTYLTSGRHRWNSGIFLVAARVLLSEMETHAPEVVRCARAALDGAVRDLDFCRLHSDSFARSPSISLDHAIMERTDKAAVIPADFAWSDIGAWSELWEAGDRDGDGNVLSGDIKAMNTRNSYVRTEGPLVATLGIEDMIVVATADAVLVARKGADQEVKQLVAALQADHHPAAVSSPLVHRPWGHFQTVELGERYQVKRITVNPGAKLSLQKHYHRAEHWVVVNGTAAVTRDGETMLLRENESVFLPLGCVHRLENPGRIPLNLIEIQSGPYLGEDDIVRFEDLYARSQDD